MIKLREPFVKLSFILAKQTLLLLKPRKQCMSATESKKKRGINWKSLKQAAALYPYIKPYQGKFLLGILFLFLSSAANLAFPKLLGDLVNASKSNNFTQSIENVALMLMAILILQATFSYFRIVLFVQVAEKALKALRQAAYQKMLKLPMAFYNSRRVGELTSRINSDIPQLQETFTTTLAEFVRQLVIIGGGISLLLFTSVRLTLFMLAILPVVVLTAVAFGRFIRKYSKKLQDEVALSSTIMEETLQGISNVKAYANELYERTRYNAKTDDVAQIAIKGVLPSGICQLYNIGFIWCGGGGYLARKSSNSQRELDTGQLFAFVLYSSFIGGSIGGMADVYARIQKAVGATESVLAIFDESEEPLNINQNIRKLPIKGNIVFNKVHFAYPSRPDMPVLQNLNMQIKAGERIALVGTSGAGKSTILNLLLRFYSPQSGLISIDNENLQHLDLTAFRKTIAWVPQDISLFGGTIAENIAYGAPGAPFETIVEAAKQAHAHHFIEAFRDAYQTLVGERGIQLSGGQRQRIAIARAILCNPAILLLDEATSALDSESEQAVQQALDALMQNRTSLVIAHRLSTVKNANNIWVIENGSVAEFGTHEDLTQRENGRFKALLNMQRLELSPN